MGDPRLHDRTGRFGAMPDVWFDDVGMAWEVDSLEWHLGPDDHARTLRENPSEVLRDLAVNHAHAANRPRPPVLALPAG